MLESKWTDERPDDVMTDEAYIDDLFAREGIGWDQTPGFRAFVLDLMGIIGERPRAGDVASMHMAYRHGMEYAPTWTTDRPTEPGEYWVSIEPGKRGSNPDPSKPTRPNRSVIPVVIEMDSVSYDPGLTVFFDRRGYGTNGRNGWIGKLDSGFFDGAQWCRRETPADPFEEG